MSIAYCALICLVTNVAASLAAAEPHRKITVAVVEDAPPFSYKTADGSWQGVAVELWEAVADRLDIDYTLVGMDRGAVIDSVAQGKADFGVGPLTMTAARLKAQDFSVPYYVTGLAIVVPEAHSLFMVLLDNALSRNFLQFLGGLLLILLIVGALLWLFERRKNAEEFGGRHVHGVGSGLWLAVVTMTTVGYGDKSPKTLGGRTIAVLWMFVSLLLVATFTGTVASVLTADRLSSAINGPEDLYRVRVVTVTGSGAAALLEGQRVPAREMPNMQLALAAVVNGTADALAMDRALLKYYLLQHPQLPVTLVPGQFFPEFYAFTLPSGSADRKRLNESILTIVESARWRKIVADYIGSHSDAMAYHSLGSPK